MHRLARAAAVAASVIWWTTPACAHPEWSPMRVNRSLKLVLGDKSRIVYTVLYGETPALPERKAADANGDGRLDADERHRLGERVAARVGAGLHVTLDGHALTLPVPTEDVGLAGEAVTPDPFSVDLTYALTIDATGPHALTIDDRVEVPDEGDSEIAIDDEPPARLLAAVRGTSGDGVEKLFTFRGPRFSLLEDRRVTVRFETKQPTPASRLRGLLDRLLRDHLGALLGAATLSLALVLALRRYRNMNG